MIRLNLTEPFLTIAAVLEAVWSLTDLYITMEIDLEENRWSSERLQENISFLQFLLLTWCSDVGDFTKEKSFTTNHLWREGFDVSVLETGSRTVLWLSPVNGHLDRMQNNSSFESYRNVLHDHNDNNVKFKGFHPLTIRSQVCGSWGSSVGVAQQSSSSRVKSLFWCLTTNTSTNAGWPSAIAAGGLLDE